MDIQYDINQDWHLLEYSASDSLVLAFSQRVVAKLEDRSRSNLLLEKAVNAEHDFELFAATSFSHLRGLTLPTYGQCLARSSLNFPRNSGAESTLFRHSELDVQAHLDVNGEEGGSKRWNGVRQLEKVFTDQPDALDGGVLTVLVAANYVPSSFEIHSLKTGSDGATLEIILSGYRIRIGYSMVVGRAACPRSLTQGGLFPTIL